MLGFWQEKLFQVLKMKGMKAPIDPEGDQVTPSTAEMGPDCPHWEKSWILIQRDPCQRH
jgi:hypothetical protein